METDAQKEDPEGKDRLLELAAALAAACAGLNANVCVEINSRLNAGVCVQIDFRLNADVCVQIDFRLQCRCMCTNNFSFASGVVERKP